MPHVNLGVLAHVDAGKTTLTERLLFEAGVVDHVGSVDAGDTQTDTLALERRRGITIRSAVVPFAIDDTIVNLVDTPGHPDFIAEVERVLDVTSAGEGVPLAPDATEALAEHDDGLLAAYVAGTPVPPRRLRQALADLTSRCLVHPVFFGSARTGHAGAGPPDVHRPRGGARPRGVEGDRSLMKRRTVRDRSQALAMADRIRSAPVSGTGRSLRARVPTVSPQPQRPLHHGGSGQFTTT